MAKAFSIASWNIEHFKKPAKNASAKAKQKYKERKPRIIEFIKNQNPDIIAIYEVEGAAVYFELRKQLKGYTFHITEGPQTQEILIGVKSGLDAFFTQKLEFKSGSSYLRPGALLTIQVDEQDYPILFLHMKSGSDPKGFGLRDDMLSKAVKFRKKLNRVSRSENGANYMFLGDLNTMGMKYPYKQTINYELELKRTDNVAKRYYGMKRLTKTHDVTYNPGSKSTLVKSDLDHVYASKHMEFKQFSNADVMVTGWVDKETEHEEDQWLDEYSDHCLLYLEVQKVKPD